MLAEYFKDNDQLPSASPLLQEKLHRLCAAWEALPEEDCAAAHWNAWWLRMNNAIEAVKKAA